MNRLSLAGEKGESTRSSALGFLLIYFKPSRVDNVGLSREKRLRQRTSAQGSLVSGNVDGRLLGFFHGLSLDGLQIERMGFENPLAHRSHDVRQHRHRRLLHLPNH